MGRGGLRIVYGVLPDLGEKAYGLLADFYRIWGRRLTDCFRIFAGFGGGGLRRLTNCLRIFTAFGGRGLRIVYGFRSVLEEKAYGLFADFYRM